MARLNVNPTRMELRRIKTRLKTAVRGHKLLKDKSDEMARQFMNYIYDNKTLREELEDEIVEALRAFMISRTLMTTQEIEQAILMPSYTVEIATSTSNLMGITVPKLDVKTGDNKELYPYGFVSTVGELDNSISRLSKLFERIIRLAEIEKTCDMLADEIEKIRRRVNALEHVMIPQLKETIKYITMKLDENERSNLIRLMKVKDLIEKRDEAAAQA